MAEVTRAGVDYIGIKEFGTTTEYIVPFNRILDVSVPSSLQGTTAESPTTP
ncbi:hypothetical protein RSSM_06677 [Rhodopirellula sallentina SM41]|uniref:Uncharacterized protein n=1 Tax=Rhodopirellula sallentina SM41 TaxID=1263870 RepID=M5TS63_9BACT|nr:hypothetical protein RSSM_06677 [Rhodopirellula sallentina SM41]